MKEQQQQPPITPTFYGRYFGDLRGSGPNLPNYNISIWILICVIFNCVISLVKYLFLYFNFSL